MKERKHLITRIEPGSIAQELEIEPGDMLVSIDGQPVEDVFDYRLMTDEEYLVLQVEKPDGELWELEIEKDAEEDLGIGFENGLMDDYRSCCNHCIFCFIDQMPPGMRETLYFKDDDSRLSFLQGNYVTLTNMSDHDLDRIIRYRMEPVNISFHTTNPQLRSRMLHNRFAGESLKKAERLYEAGISMNGQIVLCKNYNDGEELERTLADLCRYAPVLQSVSIVPVGLTRYREGLVPLVPFDRADACRLLDTVALWQKRMKEKQGIHFVHASDEWYLLAGRPLPPEECYDGYPQLENGVGLLRLQDREFHEALCAAKGDRRIRRITIATGKLAAPFLSACMDELREKFPGIRVQVREIENRFFGENITVAGLITGRDLRQQLSGTDLGEELLLPCVMLRDQEEVFLDDMTVQELETALRTPVRIVEQGGGCLLSAVIGGSEQRQHKRRQMYEQTDRSSGGPSECREVDPV